MRDAKTVGRVTGTATHTFLQNVPKKLLKNEFVLNLGLLAGHKTFLKE